MRPSLRDAALRPVNLAILGAAIVAGLAIALWLLPLGLLAYVVAVALTLFDPQAVVVRPAVPVRTAPQGTAFQPQLDNINRAQAEIERSVAAAEGPLRPALERITAPVDEIIQEAYSIASKGQLIVDYLQQTSMHDLNVQLARVEEQI